MKKLIPLLIALPLLMGGSLPPTQLAPFFAKSDEASAPVPDILQWNLTDGSGTTITAAVGPNGDTDASWISGWITGNALDFNGTSQDSASVAAVTYGNEIITVAMPVWFDATNVTGVVLESSVDFNANANTWIILTDASGLLTMAIFGGGAEYRIESCPNWTTGEWFHLLVVFDHSSINGNSGDIKVYFNAVQQSTSGAAPTLNSVANFSAQTLYQAARNRSSLWMDGRLGKLWIYSGDRSADVTAIMNAQK